jgi:ArsR family transcriptional regulator, virulence genes transcriptional regulator
MASRTLDTKAFEKRAVQVANILRTRQRAQADDPVPARRMRREQRERLAKAVGLSQSALSQHLARMREEGLVTFRRESQTLWYRIADPRIEQLFATLHRPYCRSVKPKNL